MRMPERSLLVSLLPSNIMRQHKNSVSPMGKFTVAEGNTHSVTFTRRCKNRVSRIPGRSNPHRGRCPLFLYLTKDTYVYSCDVHRDSHPRRGPRNRDLRIRDRRQPPPLQAPRRSLNKARPRGGLFYVRSVTICNLG